MSAASQRHDTNQTPSGGHTHFNFESKVFQVEGCFFSINESKDVIFNIPMGDMTGSVKLKSLCQEFGIEPDSNDYVLLEMVRRGIPYVRQIRPGDVIPSEVLDGSASWHIDPRHAEIARTKLSKRLIDWLMGTDGTEEDRAAILALAQDEDLKKRVNQALEKAATLIKKKKEEVISRFDDLGKELAYIEALRDYYQEVYKHFTMLKRYQEFYRDDNNFIQEIERMRQLMKPPIESIKHTFDEVDMETSEVLPLLKNYEQKVSFIRNARDELHLNTATWQDLKDIWAGVPLERCDESKSALQQTYKFLAKNFTVSYSW